MSLLAFAALWVVSSSVIERVRERWAAHPVASVFAGILTFIIVGGAVIAMDHVRVCVSLPPLEAAP